MNHRNNNNSIHDSIHFALFFVLNILVLLQQLHACKSCLVAQTGRLLPPLSGQTIHSTDAFGFETAIDKGIGALPFPQQRQQQQQHHHHQQQQQQSTSLQSLSVGEIYTVTNRAVKQSPPTVLRQQPPVITGYALLGYPRQIHEHCDYFFSHHKHDTKHDTLFWRFSQNRMDEGDANEKSKEDAVDSKDKKETKQDKPVSNAMVATIGIYKNYISPLLPPACRFLPTCSQYGVQAIEEFGPIKGCILTGWRLLRCSPFGGRGYDPPRWPPVFYTYSSY